MNNGYTKLDSHPIINELHSNFEIKCSNYRLNISTECKDRTLCNKIFISGIYDQCVREKRKYNNISRFLKHNDLDPFVNSYPYDLPKLSDIEEIIISKVFVVMKVHRLNGSNSVGFKGHLLNIKQDLNIR